jgi:hypothetical protein
MLAERVYCPSDHNVGGFYAKWRGQSKAGNSFGFENFLMGVKSDIAQKPS